MFRPPVLTTLLMAKRGPLLVDMWHPQKSDFSTWVKNTFKHLERNNEQGPAVLPLVIEDLEARAMQGREKYNNDYRVYTRENPLQEAYEEALDLCMYLRAAIEQDNGHA